MRCYLVLWAVSVRAYSSQSHLLFLGVWIQSKYRQHPGSFKYTTVTDTPNLLHAKFSNQITNEVKIFRWLFSSREVVKKYVWMLMGRKEGIRCAWRERQHCTEPMYFPEGKKASLTALVQARPTALASLGATGCAQSQALTWSCRLQNQLTRASHDSFASEVWEVIVHSSVVLSKQILADQFYLVILMVIIRRTNLSSL